MVVEVTNIVHDVSKVSGVALDLDDSQPKSLASFIHSKWLKLAIYIFACFATSSLYYGWQPFYRMFLYDGAYEWLCDAGEYECQAQIDSISRLYSLAAGFEYSFAIVAGFFLDHFGPRYSALVGEITWGIGLSLVAFSNESFSAFLPGMILLGCSVNIVCFPALTTMETWPQWKGLMIGLVLGAQTAGTVIPELLVVIKNKTNWTNRTIFLGYLLFVWLPVTIAYVSTLPSQRNLHAMMKQQKKDALIALDESENRLEAQSDSPVRTVSRTDDPNTSDIDISSSGTPVMKNMDKDSWKTFLKNIANIDMGLMIVFYTIMMCAYAYYPTVVKHAIGDSFSDFYGYFLPSQILWSLAVGALNDYIRTPTVSFLMVVCLWIVSFISLLHVTNGVSDGANYLSVVLITISQCAIFEIKYTYVAEMYDPHHFGKLVGLLGVAGGTGTFVNIPISAGDNYKMGFLGYTIALPIVSMIAMLLRWRQHRGVTYKTMLEDEVVRAEAAENKLE